MSPKEIPSVSSELERLERIQKRDERNALTSENDAQNATAEQEIKRRDDHDENDMRQAIRHPECRRIFQRIITECHVFSVVAVGPREGKDGRVLPSDTHETYRLDGERGIGLFLMGLLERAAPGTCLQMQREFVSDLKSQEHRRDTDGD